MSTPYPAYGDPRLQVGDNPYMYPPNNSSSQYSFTNSSTTITGKNALNPELISRTPSPTPSEEAELARKGVIDWKAATNWRFWIRREWLWYYVLAIILAVITALITIFHHQIVVKLTPPAHWVKSLPGGWLIPIAILFIISFPPLFGHEIVAILCGVVWGLWIGFAIVAAGTFLGELGNFYAFKYCCRMRGEKLERTNMQYGCLARVVREGDFKIALIARYSAIPGHFTTAVFATCGMNVFTFALAAFLSLPKQFATVYLGVIIEESGAQETISQRIASYLLIAVTTAITFIALWYIYRELNRVKPAVIYERRKARQAKMELTRSYYHHDISSVSGFNPNSSESDIPLHPYDSEQDAALEESIHQRWDESGHAIGYAPDPRLYAPRPRPPSFKPSTLYASPDAAAAATSSRDSEDEWSNAHTPKTSQPPDVATTPVPGPASIPPLASFPSAEYPPTSVPLTPSTPLSQQLPHSGHMQLPPSSTMMQYMTYEPEHFSVNPTSGSMGTRSEAVQSHYNPHSPPIAGSESTISPTFSPPPSYR